MRKQVVGEQDRLGGLQVRLARHDRRRIADEGEIRVRDEWEDRVGERCSRDLDLSLLPEVLVDVQCSGNGVEVNIENGLLVGSPEYDLRRLIRFAGLPDPIAIIPFTAQENQPWQRYRVLPESHCWHAHGPLL